MRVRLDESILHFRCLKLGRKEKNKKKRAYEKEEEEEEEEKTECNV